MWDLLLYIRAFSLNKEKRGNNLLVDFERGSGSLYDI